MSVKSRLHKLCDRQAVKECVTKNRRITRAEYTKYRMGIRNDFNVFFMNRSLFQQWIIGS